MERRQARTDQQLHARRFLLAALFCVTALAGCGPEPQGNLGAGGRAQVNLSITMPKNMETASTPHYSLWAMIGQWVFGSEAWAQNVSDISRLVTQVTGPGIPTPIVASQPVTGATSGQVISITLEVPVGPDRVFAVAAISAENTSILQGESAPITLEVGKVATVNIALRNLTAPTANAGLDQGGKLPGTLITLDGSASSDPNGDALIYRWEFTKRPAGSQAVLVNPTSMTPTFTVDRAGEYVIQLIVNDGRGDSPADTVLVSSANVPPVAEAGQDQGGQVRGTRITLNGSASSDSNGDPLTYRWAFTARPTGSQAVLVNATGVAPTFAIDQDGEYKIQLIVNDGTVDSPPDIVTVTSTNVAPVARAGPDQAGLFPAGTVITLNGSASSDLNGDPLTYRWSFTNRPTGSQAVLSNATAVSPIFTIDQDGDYLIQLIVNDRRVDSPADTVLVTSRNIAPVANAGQDQGNKLPGALITLNGSASSDANRDPLTYRWSFTNRPEGSQAVLSSPTGVSPTFSIDRDGDYVIQLVANDGKLDSQPDTVIVNSANVDPVANAGPDQTAEREVEGSVIVALDGSASFDANRDPLTYKWSLTSAPVECDTELSNAASVRATLVARCSGSFVLQLIVNDGTVDSRPDTVTVTITRANVNPVADAGPDQIVEFPLEGSLTVTLDGSKSFDVNGDQLTYRWSFTSRPFNSESSSDAVLVNPTSVSPTFDPDLVGDYVIQLIVNDGRGDSKVDTVTITVGNSCCSEGE